MAQRIDGWKLFAVPTGYIIQLIGGGCDATFIKNIALTSAQVNLLSDEVAQDLVYYTPR
jgi:hypothetical protein